MKNKKELPPSGSRTVLVEVSHASASDQSRFLSVHLIELRHLRHLIPELFMSFACLIFTTILILAWFVDIPVLSSNLKRHSRFSVPLTVTCIVALGVILAVCLWRVMEVIGCCRICTRMHVQDIQAPSPAEETPSRDTGKLRTHRKHFPKLCDLSDDTLVVVREIAVGYASNKSLYDSRLIISAPSIHATDDSLTDSVRTNASGCEIVSFDVSAKVALVGASNAGKTSIFHRILYNRFSEHYVSTLGIDIGFTTLNLICEEREHQMNVGLQLWDVAGTERTSDLSAVAYKDVLAFIIVIDVTDVSSLEYGLTWLQDINAKKFDPFVAIFANKIDKEAIQPFGSDLEAKCGTISADVHRVSAKSGGGITDAFVDVIMKSIVHEIEKLA